MTKRRLYIVLAAILFSSQAASNELTSALDNHARNSARTILTGMIEQRGKSMTWPDILRNYLPQQIDVRCGYQDQARLREVGFDRMKEGTQALLGKRLEETMGPLLSRPDARLDLVIVQSRVSNGIGHSIVAMRVTPARTGDRLFTLHMRVDDSGYMRLCDVSQGIQFDGGLLKQIGNQLWNQKD